MGNLLRILLVLGMIMGGFIIAVSAVPTTDENIKIDLTIEGGNAADMMHGEKGWLIAGSGVTSKIRVSNKEGKSPDIHYVSFTLVENGKYGDVSRAYVTSAPYDTVFSASKKTAGNASIRVLVNYSIGEDWHDYETIVYQPIDHNVPYKIHSIDFKSEATVGGETDITLKMEDKYGNTVNSLYENKTGGTPEMVTFSTSLHAGSGFLKKGTADPVESLSESVNEYGEAIATFQVGTEVGPKYLIHMVPPHPLNDEWRTITAIGDATPYKIRVTVNPPNVDNPGDPPSVPADGKSKFFLTYTLSDQYGNPSGNQIVHFTDSFIGKKFSERTNSKGEVKFSFGPFDLAVLLNIHADADKNPLLTSDQKLRFTNTTSEDMVLTANSQSIPSAEVAPDFKAQIFAKVIDETGSGVRGEEVQFFITNDSWIPAHDKDPILDNDWAVTDVDGIATVNFTPGSFKENVDAENKIIPAFENCTVVATWNKKVRQIDLEWRNYPYLRVETEVNPEKVEVGNPVNVTIRLIGDGYALHPDPIDVMLCVDRSSSMLEDYPDRMVSAMAAMKTFNGKMEKGKDRVGLTSFGDNTGTSAADIFTYSYSYWAGNDSYDDYIVPGQYDWVWSDWYNDWIRKWVAKHYDDYEDQAYVATHYPGNAVTKYPDYATLDLSLTKEIDTANTTVDLLVPRGGTPMRGGLYKAITELISNKEGNKDAVQAVILLTDGDYNFYGDPLARGDGYTNKYPNDGDFVEKTEKYYWFSGLSKQNQSMSAYAVNNSIKIFAISFGEEPSTWGNSTLTTLATGTGGKYYHAPNGEKLAAIYTDIAGALKTEAGVNTTMDLAFTNIELNNVSVVNNKTDPFLKYEYRNGISTQIKSWNTTFSPPGSAENPNVMGPKTLDQRDDWAANQSLNFNITDIGTIHLHQTWQAVFMLNVTKAGNINIFGDDSALYFNNRIDKLSLPKTYITAFYDPNSTGINFTGLEVTDLICVEAENNYTITDYLTMKWNLTYSSSENTTTQYLYYQKESDGIWNKFGEKSPVSGPVSESLQTDKLYVAEFPPGYYKLRVRAMADDAPDSVVETLMPIMIGTGGRAYIKLE